mmetsp:Transcript_3483/g.5170  ORF Transcript_3483/g.5170 Transcript_3483/m.5170 type:complete len:341 (-) Transcript_3483:77-1099(-)
MSATGKKFTKRAIAAPADGKWPRLKHHYKLLKEIGKGGFGTVYLAESVEDGKKYAVKVMWKNAIKKVDRDLHHLEQEINILYALDHPKILGIDDLIITKTTVCIVTQLCSGGDLLDKIIDDGPYTENNAAKVMQQLLQALEYSHGQKVVHRDLKPENLMLASADNMTDIRVIDFGLGKLLDDGVVTHTVCGTPQYAAPEVLLPVVDGKNAKSGHSFDVDIWSAGVVAYCLLSGTPPFWSPTNDQGELLKKVVKGDFDFPQEIWEDVSQEAQDFISACLTVDPAKRPSATELLKHKWITTYTAPDAPGTIQLEAAYEMLQDYVSQIHSHSKTFKAVPFDAE